jgi:catechol 2,3-dioxygenase
MALPGSSEKAIPPFVVDSRVHIGHVHLKVADLARALDFYCGILGFEVTQRMGDTAAFLSAGGYHHHIALNTWESLGGSPPPPGTTGLYHTAIVYPSRAALAGAVKRVISARIPLEGAADHGVSESIYLRDPDDNGVEFILTNPGNSGLARPMASWPCSPARSIFAAFSRKRCRTCLSLPAPKICNRPRSAEFGCPALAFDGWSS